jgi:hypothetical protein
MEFGESVRNSEEYAVSVFVLGGKARRARFGGPSKLKIFDKAGDPRLGVRENGSYGQNLLIGVVVPFRLVEHELPFALFRPNVRKRQDAHRLW